METILLQEPDAAIFDVVSTALRIKGYQVCRLDDQHKNIMEIIRRHHAKLVLLDCWLARPSTKLCHWIKFHFPRLPVVAFSWDNTIDEQFRSVGFDGYLKKPFDLEDLYGVVRKLVPGHKRRELIIEETAV